MQSGSCFQSGANPYHERLLRLDAMGGKSQPQLPPTLLGEYAGVAQIFAATICSTSAKREVQVELLALASDVLDMQGVMLLRAPLGASVLAKEIDPSGTDAGLDSRLFIHGKSR
jgi:hypothetical protein